MVLDDCLRLHPEHASALAERRRVALRDGDNRDAEDYLARSLRPDPSKAPTHYQYFLALSRNGKDAEAVREQETMRRMEADVRQINEIVPGRLPRTPNDPGLHYEVAMIALRAGRPKEALRWLHNALRVDPNHLPTHRALVTYYHETGNPILAARHRAIAQRLSSSP